MLSLFVSKLNRASTGDWNPDRFKIDAPKEYDSDSVYEEEAEALEESYPQYQPQPQYLYSSAYSRPPPPMPIQPMQPMQPYYHQHQQWGYPHPQAPSTPSNQVDTSLMYNPNLYRAMDHIPPEVSDMFKDPVPRQTRENFRQVIKPQETSNLSVNPVENLEASIAMRSAPSAPAQLMETWSNQYCEDAIPSKYLTESTQASFELMGLNEAQRRSRPMGEGVPNIGPAVPFEQINEQNYGHGQTQYSMVSHDLYHQDFATLGATPAVYTGIYTDPLTGIQYDTYESAMPPPDGDWYDECTSSGKNRILDQLQGGWSNNTPIPPRKEILEGDWNQGYDRPINTYGGSGSYADVLRCRNLDNFERSTRFTLNDFTPDNEAPELTGVPANVDGIYGNVKVRFLPRLAGTNRGHEEEDSFRTGPYGIDTHNQHMAQEYTKMPQCFPSLDYVGPVSGSHGVYGEQSRSDYEESHKFTGLEVNPELTEHGAAYVDTYGDQSRSDYNIPHKFTGLTVNEELGEHGVAIVDAYGEQSRSDYNMPHKFTGLMVNEQLSVHGVNDGGGYALQNRSEYNTPNKIMGQEVNPELSVHGVNDGGGHAGTNRMEYNTPNKYTGLDVNEQLSEHGFSDGGAQAPQNRMEYNVPHKFTGTEINPELSEHGVGFVDAYGEQSRSDYNLPHKFTGTEVNPELSEHGVQGHVYAGQNRKALTRYNRVALLKSMQGAFKSGTDAQMTRTYPTRFNTRKNTTNKVVVPSRMAAGLSGSETVERVPTEWSHRRTPQSHRPSQERVGAVSKAVENDVPIVGQMPVKLEQDLWRMGPAHAQIGSANATIYSLITRPQGPCVSY
jgi:hypothetical protein